MEGEELLGSGELTHCWCGSHKLRGENMCESSLEMVRQGEYHNTCHFNSMLVKMLVVILDFSKSENKSHVECAKFLTCHYRVQLSSY